MKNTPIHLITKIALGIVVITAIVSCAPTEVGTHIALEAYVGDEPLVFGKQYPSPNGDGTYMIIDFKFYISNLKLTNDKDSTIYLEEDSYHLVKFSEDHIYSFELNDVNPASFNKMSLSVGIDEEANLGTIIAGDLDPTNQMAWNWTAGYKFLLLEGKYMPESSGKTIPLVYHIGFSENRRDLTFDLAASNDIQLRIDINELFQNPSIVDFNKFAEVLFNKTDANIVAENYGKSFIVINR